jgi:hypothetical protein
MSIVGHEVIEPHEFSRHLASQSAGQSMVVPSSNPAIDSLLCRARFLLRATLREGKRLSGYQMAEVQVNKADGEHSADFIRSILKSCASSPLG